MNTYKVGKMGEEKACEYLIKKGYKILKRNYREKFDEIDIIARERNCTLVFIEVKALSIGAYSKLIPEDNFTKQKDKKVKRACQLFASKNPDLIDERRGWRIDLIAVEILETGKVSIRHYENV